MNSYCKDSRIVTIVVPCFDRVKLIHETLGSVLAQTNPKWECIVVDDGSTDGSFELANSYVEKDSRFKVISRNRLPKGACSCRNIGLELARGDYVIFLDSDDLLPPDRVELTFQYFEMEGEVDFLVFECELFENTPGDMGLLQNYIEQGDLLYRFLIHDNPWLTCDTSWKKKSLDPNPWYEEAEFYQDWIFNIDRLIQGLKPKFLNGEIGYYWRQGSYQRISNSKGDKKRVIKAVNLLKYVENKLIINGVYFDKYREAVMAGYYFACKKSVFKYFEVPEAFKQWNLLFLQRRLPTIFYIIGILNLFVFKHEIIGIKITYSSKHRFKIDKNVKLQRNKQ